MGFRATGLLEFLKCIMYLKNAVVFEKGFWKIHVISLRKDRVFNSENQIPTGAKQVVHTVVPPLSEGDSFQDPQ